MEKPKPDDRSNNPERIENTIGHTLQNMDEARDFEKAHSEELSEEEKQQIEAKNQRREESIDGMRQEIKDEVNDQKQ
ncbi:small acid-soluble spore protein (thioredoxin-like protein) [Salibacterium salarium]|uniref:small acid-soluble spore protein Tlp n=1 Tax=Salibacterium salarium TaxID=284579 RepID=UPI00277E0B41|nr:small acid-soluble spore protein Tlp [Salibacterium salarium]MDQ0300048.1 small acid-soluble spore protein (thioredoxin-like protein) [Salibacterium salarium]